ncbi:MAG: hypothetical protein ACE5DQ_03095, partial [Candidatus Paceibacterota bacterium]
QDGFRKDIFVTLYDRDTQTPIYTQRFNANTQYTLIGGSRFKELSAPFTIPANTHLVIAAYGYSCNSPYELNGNSNGAIPEWMTNNGGDAISFVGKSRYADYPDQFPDIHDTGPENRYAAGTLIFQPL